MNIRVFLEWYHDRNSRKSKCLETESILANLSDEIFGTSCLPRRTRVSRLRSPPPRQRPPKSPAPDSIANFTTDYRTVKRHESCHMTDLKIKNFLVCDAACLIMTTRFKSFSQCWYLIFFQPSQQFLKYFLYPGTPRGLICLERSSTHGRPWIKGSSTDRV